MRNWLVQNRPILLMGLIYIGAITLLLVTDAPKAAMEAYADLNGSYLSFVVENISFVFLEIPLVLLAILYVWIAPGLFLVLSYGSPRSFTDWIAKGFVATYIIQFLAVTIGKLGSEVPLSRFVFFCAIIAATGFIYVLTIWRFGYGQYQTALFKTPVFLRRMFITLLISYAGITLLFPFIFWQDFNPDGLEALIIAESVSWYAFPRIVSPAGVLSVGTGVISPAYPFHFFLMIVGPIEAAVRLPFLLLLPIIYSLLIGVIEWGKTRALGTVHELLIVLALAIFTVVTVFSASYDYYIADMAAPAAEDVMVVLCVLGLFYALYHQSVWTLIGYAVIGSFSRPTMFLFFMFIIGAILLVKRFSGKQWLSLLGIAIISSTICALLYQLLYVPTAIESATLPSSIQVFKRFRYLTLFDWQRIAYLLFPCGIIPVFALILFKKQDDASRVITLVTLLYFGFFYINAFVALHHFMPIMILPLVVFWRTYLDVERSIPYHRVAIFTILFAGILSLWMSLPNHLSIVRIARTIGERTIFLVGDSNKELRTMNDQADILGEVAVGNGWYADPATEYLTWPLVIVYYADRSGLATSKHNYIVLPEDEAAPKDAIQVKQMHGIHLYVQDKELAKRDRFQPMNINYRSPLYDIAPETLFPYIGRPNKNYDIDLAVLLGVR